MLDIKLIREHPEIIMKDLEKRNDRERMKLLDKVISLDKKRRILIKNSEDLKKERNGITKEISRLKSEGKNVSSLLKKAEELPEKIKNLDEELSLIEKQCTAILKVMPNILHESVPVGKDDSENVEIRQWGKKPQFGFEPRSHIDLGIMLGVMDTERAAKISGARFYFLKNELVILNQSVLRFAVDHLIKKGFIPVQPPYMLRREAYEGVTDLTDFEMVMYKIENEDLHLIATSEHPIAAMHMNEKIDEEELPLKYAGISPCFRKEAGAHGKDTKGIFRVHQFDKVEQFIFCHPNDSWRIHDELLLNTEEIFRMLEIPYRVVSICTGDIGTVAAKKYDIEAWLPAQQKYREMASCSNCTDYQARRLNIKYGKKDAPATGLVHTLNNTGLASPRAIVAIMENFQQEDGSIKIPKALQHYTGFEKIPGNGR
ncbi:MAG: serine--tRNA ligase [Candidatus Aenigmarchaeota archaeon]|nr:serine--tRNA ligase [Candidatus Aenigmarchaeota archaeon]MDI6722274.1 serine--tRNA ligase [Candidatus Aenigmarchaeota archaeon]